MTHHYSDLSLLRAAGGTAHQFTLLFVYFMCTPRCIIFFQCGPGQSKVWTPPALGKKLLFGFGWRVQVLDPRSSFFAVCIPIGEINPSVCTGDHFHKERKQGKIPNFRIVSRTRGYWESSNGHACFRNSCLKGEFPSLLEHLVLSLTQEVKGNFSNSTQIAKIL